jgi:acyl-[acyl-carrier-protein]-phospholipid O-acyltransferase/long-chain-fatty-acid--[acyl-carrier-protein] ligase
MSARILDPDSGAQLPLTSRGIVCLRGPNVFSGYLGDREATEAALRDGWLVTGDIGRFDEDGFLTIEDRVSRFSKIAGEMVSHGAVEQALVEALSLDQAEGPLIVVLGVTDSAKGEALVLVTTLDLDFSRIREDLVAAGLPNLWIPKFVQRVGAIPRLASGKIDLKSCREAATRAAGG